MEAHTPKREAIEKFVKHESSAVSPWLIGVADEPHNPVVRLTARRDDTPNAQPEKYLEVHTRQVRLTDDELDESTKTMIRRWMASL